jgi:hypothetical protein
MGNNFWYQALNRTTGRVHWFRISPGDDTRYIPTGNLGTNRSLADYYAALYMQANPLSLSVLQGQGWGDYDIQFVGQTDSDLSESDSIERLRQTAGPMVRGIAIPDQGQFTPWVPPLSVHQTTDTLSQMVGGGGGGDEARPPGLRPLGRGPGGGDDPGSAYRQGILASGRPIGPGSGVMGAYAAEQAQPFRRAYQAAQSLVGTPEGGLPRSFYDFTMGTRSEDIPQLQRQVLGAAGRLDPATLTPSARNRAMGYWNTSDQQGIVDIANLFRGSKATQVGSFASSLEPSVSQAVQAFWAQRRDGLQDPYSFFRNFYGTQAYTQPSAMGWDPVEAQNLASEMDAGG